MDALHRTLDTLLARAFDPPPAVREVRPLRGRASARAYHRVSLEPGTGPTHTPASLIAMVLPGAATGSEEASGAEAVGELPFLQVQRLLASRGVPVPHVHASDVDNGVLLLEDLGDETLGARFDRATPQERDVLYTQAIRLLARMHRACAQPDAACVAFQRNFERPLLRWELDHFLEWGLEAVHGRLPDAVRAELAEDFDTLADAIAALPRGFVHRDFQSSNLMVRPADDTLVVLDFQDALRGPYCYDLVALLCDSYVDVPLELQKALLARYAAEMGDLDVQELERHFWLVAAQRKLKDAGRFVFIDRQRGNPDFLRWVPPSLVHVGHALDRLPRFSRLRERLQQLLPGFPHAVPMPASHSVPTEE